MSFGQSFRRINWISGPVLTHIAPPPLALSGISTWSNSCRTAVVRAGMMIDVMIASGEINPTSTGTSTRAVSRTAMNEMKGTAVRGPDPRKGASPATVRIRTKTNTNAKSVLARGKRPREEAQGTIAPTKSPVVPVLLGTLCWGRVDVRVIPSLRTCLCGRFWRAWKMYAHVHRTTTRQLYNSYSPVL